MGKTNERGLRNCGVYCITNTTSNKVYVGSSVNFSRRWRQHRRELNKGIHGNVYLQKAWRKYGAEAFTFTVLEYETDLRKLVEAEQRWIDLYQSYDSAHGYNINPVAGSIAAIWQDPEKRRAQSEKIKQLWRDPKYRQAMTESLRVYHQAPEARLDASRRSRILWADPEARQARAECAKQMWQNPEIRERITESARRQWDDPDFVAKIMSRRREVEQDPKYAAKSREIRKQAWTPEKRQRHSELTKRIREIEGMRERYSLALRASWTPERRRAKSEAVKRHFVNNPSLRIEARERAKRLHDDPERSKKIADKKKATWSEAGKKKARSEQVKALWQDPEYRSRTVQSMEKFIQTMMTENPEEWAASVEKRAEGLRKPEARQAASEKMKLLWQDPEYREKALINLQNIKRNSRSVATPPCPHCKSEDTSSKGSYGERRRMLCSTCGKSSIYYP